MNFTAQLRPAVFFDRDGTLIEDRGHLSDVAQAAVFQNTIPALRRLKNDFLFFIVTNQSGVAKGLIELRDVERINAHLIALLADAGLTFSAVYVCPHSCEEGCPCMKPKAFFLHKAAEEHGIDLGESYVIGDHPHDVELAKNAGARGIYVCTGHGVKHLNELNNGEIVVPHIEAAADWILSRKPIPKHLPPQQPPGEANDDL